MVARSDGPVWTPGIPDRCVPPRPAGTSLRAQRVRPVVQDPALGRHLRSWASRRSPHHSLSHGTSSASRRACRCPPRPSRARFRPPPRPPPSSAGPAAYQARRAPLPPRLRLYWSSWEDSEAVGRAVASLRKPLFQQHQRRVGHLAPYRKPCGATPIPASFHLPISAALFLPSSLLIKFQESSKNVITHVV